MQDLGGQLIIRPKAVARAFLSFTIFITGDSACCSVQWWEGLLLLDTIVDQVLRIFYDYVFSRIRVLRYLAQAFFCFTINTIV